MLSFVKICSTRSNHYSRVSCDVIMFLNQFLLNHRKKTLQIDLLKFFFYGLNSEFKTNSNNFMSRSYLPHSHRLFTRKRLVRFFCRGRITFRGKDCSPSYLFFQHTRKKKRVKHKGVGEGRRANRVYLAKSSVLRWRLISRNSIRALNDRIKIREKRGL